MRPITLAFHGGLDSRRGELTQPLAAMGVANRARQRVRGVGGRYAAQGEQALDHLLHLFFSRVAIANDGLFHLQRGVFRDRQSCTTAAQIAVPRACPSSRVDCGLALTKTFSRAICSGRHSAITSFKPSNIDLEAQRELAREAF